MSLSFSQLKKTIDINTYSLFYSKNCYSYGCIIPAKTSQANKVLATKLKII